MIAGLMGKIPHASGQKALRFAANSMTASIGVAVHPFPVVLRFVTKTSAANMRHKSIINYWMLRFATKTSAANIGF